MFTVGNQVVWSATWAHAFSLLPSYSVLSISVDSRRPLSCYRRLHRFSLYPCCHCQVPRCRVWPPSRKHPKRMWRDAQVPSSSRRDAVDSNSVRVTSRRFTSRRVRFDLIFVVIRAYRRRICSSLSCWLLFSFPTALNQNGGLPCVRRHRICDSAMLQASCHESTCQSAVARRERQVSHVLTSCFIMSVCLPVLSPSCRPWRPMLQDSSNF